MSCDETRELLPWLLNGTLEEPERERVLAHLNDCAGCRAELAETRAVSRIFAAHPASAELVAYAFDEPGELDRETIARHLALCERCAGELELLAESRRSRDEEGADDGSEERAPADAGVLPFRRPAAAPASGARERTWRWAALAAGLTALAAAGGWMWSWQQATSLAGRVAEEQRNATATAARVAELEKRTAELGTAAEQARAAAARLAGEQPGAGARTAPPPEVQLNTPIIDLFPGDVVVRGAGGAPPAARALPAGAEPVTLVLNVSDRREFPAYELRLLDAHGAEVARRRGLRRDPETGAFTLSLPTALLAGGAGKIEVWGVRAGAPDVEIAAYPVTVAGGK
jgi:Putative zinc-finger